MNYIKNFPVQYFFFLFLLFLVHTTAFVTSAPSLESNTNIRNSIKNTKSLRHLVDVVKPTVAAESHQQR